MFAAPRGGRLGTFGRRRSLAAAGPRRYPHTAETT